MTLTTFLVSTLTSLHQQIPRTKRKYQILFNTRKPKIIKKCIQATYSECEGETNTLHMYGQVVQRYLLK